MITKPHNDMQLRRIAGIIALSQFFFGFLIGQKCCTSNVDFQYIGNDSSTKSTITIFFENGFDDQILVSLNGKQILDKHIKTQFSTGFTNETVTLDANKLHVSKNIIKIDNKVIILMRKCSKIIK